MRVEMRKSTINRARTQQRNKSMARDKTQKAGSSALEVLEMFARVPIDVLEEKCSELLNATRHVSQGRDLPMVEEPDNAIRLKVWQTIIEHRAGAPSSRKPTEIAPDDKGDADKGALRPVKAS